MFKLIYTIHDVSHETFSRVKEIKDILAQAGVGKLIFLIIPLSGWEKKQLEELSLLQRQGHILGAHGLRHESVIKKKTYHRIHSTIFSRTTAEHLSISRESGKKLIAESYRWFEKSNLEPPELYVPPAWTLGKVKPRDFRDTGFRWVETISGIYNVQARSFRRMPLVGFEADTSSRAVFLRSFNAVNIALAKMLNKPLRIAIHPYDLKLLLSKQLLAVIKNIGDAPCSR